MMREYAALMPVERPADLQDLLGPRVAFSQRFRTHMGREDGLERLVRTSGIDMAGEQVVREHRNRIMALFLRYSNHIKHWAPAQIERDWPGYRRDVLDLQKTLTTLMDWEERNLHPLAAGLKAA